MKKLIASVTVAAVILLLSTTGLANAGPTYWPGHLSSDIMLIQENSPIAVKSENLVFDLSDNDGFDHTIGGRVTATYKMINPTEESQSVQMAFPLVGSIVRLSPDDIAITANGANVPYELFVGDVVDRYGDPQEKRPSFDFADIVSTITNDIYEAKNFEVHEKGKLYLIEVKPTTEQRINFAVDFNLDHEKTKVLTKGFNSFEGEGMRTRIAAWCYEPEVLEIYVLGEDIDLNINAYSDGELKQKTDLLTYQITSQEIEFKTYLMEHIIKDADRVKNDMLSDTKLYNLYAKALDTYLSQNMGYVYEQDILQPAYDERILTLVYTVEFSPHSEQEVSVSYKTAGTMDKTKTAKPLYSFDYILNPAKNWGSFENLNIEIMTPQEAPYIVKSSVDFTKGENNIYTATLAELPEEDLSFTLYAQEKITLADKIEGQVYRRFRYLTPFAILGLGFVVILNVVATIVKLIKAKLN